MKKRLLILFIVLIGLTQLFSISLDPAFEIDNPNSSAKMLQGEDFWDTDEIQEGRYRLYLTTMGRDDPLYVWFGHTSLIVEDTQTGRSVMYDFGIVSFEDGFYRQFALGRLWYLTWATDARMRISIAQDEQRDISQVELNLPEHVIIEVLRHLNMVTDREHNTYLYHYYDENCSTRIRDIIDTATSGQFSAWAKAEPYPLTLRELVAKSSAGNPLVMLMLDFLQGGAIDREISAWEAMFLPHILEEEVLAFSYTDIDGIRVPLAENREILSTEPEGLRPDMNQSRGKANLLLFLASLGTAAMTLFLKRMRLHALFSGARSTATVLFGLITSAWTLIFSLFSLLILFLMSATTHDVAYFNENIILVSPLALIMFVAVIPFLFNRKGNMELLERLNTVAVWICIAHIVLKAVFPEYLYQNNYNIFAVILPLYVANSTFSRALLMKRTRTLSDRTW